MKITSMTKQQAARMPEFVDKWLAIGLSTQEADFEAATEAALKAYELCKLKKPMLILRTSSPYGAAVGGAIAWAFLREFSSTKIGSKIDSQIGSQIRSKIRSKIGSGIGNYRGGNTWSSWCAYVAFMRDVLGWSDPVLTERFVIDEQLAKSCGWVWWHENVLAITDRPCEIHRNPQHQLHRDGGPAMLYRDGWAIHCLNGVAVKPEYAETPAERIAPETVLAESNVDVRRELIRKVGIDRMLAELPHKELSIKGNYRLLSINLGGEATDARYLKMLNPSVGCFHLEGVAPECDTVEKALNWRNSQWHESAEILT